MLNNRTTRGKHISGKAVDGEEYEIQFGMYSPVFIENSGITTNVKT